MPDPTEAFANHTSEGGFTRELFVVERCIEVASDHPCNCAQFAIDRLHRFDVRLQLPGRFLPHRNILANFAAITF